MDFDKNRSAGYLVNHVARLFAHGLSERIKPLGLSIGAFPVLLELWEADGLTQGQLVERLSIKQATMANTLARMERDGLIVRTKNEEDGRVQHVFLTEAAKEKRGAAIAAAQTVNALTLSPLSLAEQRQFLILAWRIIEASR